MGVSHNTPNWHSSYTCRNPECKKFVVVPWGANGDEYGYWYRGMRCCSYSCMRKLEKQYESDPLLSCDKSELNVLKQRHKKFTKLDKFMNLMFEGADQDEAAVEAGFPNLKAAVNCRYKWYGRAEWKEWLTYRERLDAIC